MLVLIDYTNWKGQRRERQINPTEIRFRSSFHHPEPQWLLDAWDMEKGDIRTFAIKDIHNWTPVEE